MKKKTLAMILCLALVFSFAACKSDEKPDDTSVSKEESTTEEAVKSTESAISDYDVKLYYANMEYINTGDESLTSMLGPFDYTLQSVNKGEQYSLLLAALSDTHGEDDAYTMTSDVIFNSATVENNTAYVDIKSEGSRLDGSALEEMLFLEQVVSALTDSFSEITQVQFTVDGQIKETLMGYMHTSSPLTKYDVETHEANEDGW